MRILFTILALKYQQCILFWKWKMWKFSYSFHIMAFFYFINWIVAVENIEGGKLFQGGNYLRKYGIQKFCSCPPQNLLHQWFRFNRKNSPLNLVHKQSVWYILAVLWQDFGCHELFSTDISMHLKKRSVEGALCVEIEVYSDISC